MRPDDANGKLPPEKRPFRVLLIAGSGRRQYNCPGVDSKARALVMRMAARMPADWEVDIEDLGNVYARAHIQSCNACVSTSMALCVWPCNCYEKDSKAEPDLMWELDLYARLDLADAWLIVGPVNWYAPTSNLKLFFDRLVCMNGGNPREELIRHKDPELAMKLERAPEWKALSVNHLEGRSAAFFLYGDGGGDELDASGRPQILRHKAWFDPEKEPFEDMRDAYAPIVWQCRYGGVEVPDDLWAYTELGKDKPYSLNQAEHMEADPAHPFAVSDAFADRFAAFVGAKGKVQPGVHRAFGYDPPRHLAADIRLAWREAKMAIGHAPDGSSPAKQHELGLNQDATFHPSKGEGKKLRDS